MIKRLSRTLIFFSGTLVFIIFIKFFILDIMKINGYSMEPTLRSGQLILVNRISYGLVLPILNKYILKWGNPQKGDIVIINNRSENKLMVKRCVATGMDQIEVKNGYLLINGIQHPHPVGSSLYLGRFDRVPEKHILVLGDNPEDSIDSRFFGFVPEDDVVGKMMF